MVFDVLDDLFEKIGHAGVGLARIPAKVSMVYLQEGVGNVVVLPNKFVDDQLVHHVHQFSDLRWQSVPYFLEEVVDEPEIIPVRHDVLSDLGQERSHLFGLDDWH